jgi:hypothetical protein
MEDVEFLKQVSTKSFAKVWKNVIFCNVARWYCKGHGTLKLNTQIPLKHSNREVLKGFIH